MGEADTTTRCSPRLRVPVRAVIDDARTQNGKNQTQNRLEREGTTRWCERMRDTPAASEMG